MLHSLTEDQDVFRSTTAKFLNEHASPDTLRALRDDPPGFSMDYWGRGAELGWTSLLVRDEHGGGTISGMGMVDLGLIAYEFGRHAAPGPLVPTNIVASTLSLYGSHRDVLSGILSGSTITSWCAPPMNWATNEWNPGIEIDIVNDHVEISGVASGVESACHAGHFLVTGLSQSGLSQVVVPATAQGVTVASMGTVDLSRRFGLVTFDRVRQPTTAFVGAVGEAAADAQRQLQTMMVLLTAEAVGSMQSAFDMTVEWAFDRFAFGRPLASYQALKHRFADMLSWLEASHAISDAACLSLQAQEGETPELVSAAKAYVGEQSAELLQECIQLHGGIGLTFEHDLHLYLRRVTVNRSLGGSPGDHRTFVATRFAEMMAVST